MKSFRFAFVFALCIIAFVGKANAQGDIYINADSTYFAPTEAFMVSVDVDNVLGLFGTSFDLIYDQTEYIRVDSIFTTDFLGNDLLFYTSQDSGIVSVAVSRKNGVSGVDGSGSVLNVFLSAVEGTPLGTVINFSLMNVVSTDSVGLDIVLVNTLDLDIVIDGVIVWPGDTNNDEYVNQSDILPIGVYWHTSGVARDAASRLWAAQPAIAWTPVASTYADADGNGYVDQADVLPIGTNWHNSQTALLAGNVNQANARFDASMMNVSVVKTDELNNIYTISLELNDNAASIFRGISFAAGSVAGTQIVNVERGDFWSTNALYLGMDDNGSWGVGITEVPGSSFSSGGNLINFVVQAENDVTNPAALIFIEDIKISTVDGNVTDLGTLADILAASGASASLPKAFSLSQNSPNPFNPSTTINYSVPDGSSSRVKLNVYDIRGMLVRSLVDAYLDAGTYSVQWNGTTDSGAPVSSGIYFYRLQTDNNSQTRKMVLLK